MDNYIDRRIAIGGKATMAEIWEWAKQPAESAD